VVNAQDHFGLINQKVIGGSSTQANQTDNEQMTFKKQPRLFIPTSPMKENGVTLEQNPINKIVT
jgi:hypothetical protein